jgi:phospholipid/cholesterol/gamma-HCH transport system substrate-binding protein
MAAPTNHWKLGLFVVGGIVMLLTTVAVLGARNLHTEVEHCVSYFDESVQGLDVGSPIKFRGVTIGTVSGIDIAPDHRNVEVRSDLGVAELTRLGLDVAMGPVRHGAPKKLEIASDLRVQLASSGLTGVKFLQLDFFVVADNPEPVLTFPVPENYIPAAPSTMKNIEDSLVRVIHRMPEVVEQMSGVLSRVDAILGDVQAKELPAQVVATLEHANGVLGEAQRKIEQVDTKNLSKDAQKTLAGLTQTVARMNALLARVDGDKGLLASVARASDAFGDTVRGADGLGSDLSEALQAVQEAARSIHALADLLERDPDMLLKGRRRTVEKNR